MFFKKNLILILLLVLPFILKADEESIADVMYMENKMRNIIREKYNLLNINESVGKQNIQVFLDDIPDYPSICETFIFAKEYSNFELVNTLKNSNSNSECFAYYKVNSNLADSKCDVYIEVTVAPTKKEAHTQIIKFVNLSTMMEVYPSSVIGIFVGDLAIGSQERLIFVRGNVCVNVHGYRETSIINLAQEIDKQILDIINKQEE